MRHEPANLLLYGLVDQVELDLIAASGWLTFVARSPDPFIFYTLLPEDSATDVTSSLREPSDDVKYVLRFALDAEYAALLSIQKTGTYSYEEVWLPANELPQFNQHIIGRIEIAAVLKAA